MHVALLTDADVFAGTERHILDLADALRQMREAPHVSIVCPQPSPLAQRAQQSGIAITPIASSAAGILHWPTVLRLKQLLQSGKVDILHAHNGRMALHAAIAKSLAGRGRIFATQHFLTPSHATQTGFKAKLFHAAHRWVAEKVTGYIAISEAVAQAMKSRGEADPAKITTVLNGLPEIDLHSLRSSDEVRAEFSLAADIPLIVCAARLEKEKSLETLIAAIGLLREEEITLRCLIAGEGDEKAFLQSCIDNAKLGQSLQLLGFREDVRSLIGAADIFVLPSLAEPFGLVLLEAMTLSRPIVATNAGGPPEIIDDDVCGLLVPPADAQALAAALQTLIEKPALRDDMGKNGRLRYETQFRAQHMAKNISEVYKQGQAI
jgi:glycosyltransferase involved in cell wall biosynthesis